MQHVHSATIWPYPWARWSLGFVLLHWAPLRTYLFGTAKGHNRPRAISKTMKWVPPQLKLYEKAVQLCKDVLHP